MKNNNHSHPYRTLGIDKIEAPNKMNTDKRSSVKTVGNDLRVGGKR